MPVNGYYEWYVSSQLNAAGKPKKQPFCMEHPDGDILTIAGLYEWWRPARTEPWLLTCTLLTRAAAPNLEQIHDRMPVVLEPKNWKTWLEADPGTLAKMLVPADKGILDMYPVSTQVNNARYQGSNCIEQVE